MRPSHQVIYGLQGDHPFPSAPEGSMEIVKARIILVSHVDPNHDLDMRCEVVLSRNAPRETKIELVQALIDSLEEHIAELRSLIPPSKKEGG